MEGNMKMSSNENAIMRGRMGRGAMLGTVAFGALLAGISGAYAQTITVWSGYPELAPFYEHVAEGFKETHPGVTIDVQAIPLREHERRVALGLSSGSAGAVVVELNSATASRYIENELFNAASAEASDFVQNPDNFGEFFSDGVNYEGAVYGVPLFRGQSALFYNLDMFAEAGLDGPPQTMEDYTEYAKALTKRDGAGNLDVTGWSLRLSGGGQGIAEKFWINMFQFDGGMMIEEVTPGKYRINLNNEAGRAALGQYLDNIHTEKTVSVEAPADAEAFEREQTAMFIRESWVIGDIAAKAPDLNYATAPLPYGAIGLPVNLYVSAEGDAEQAAWDYVQATNDPDNLVWLLENVGWLPNRHNVDYSPVTEAEPAFAAFVDYPEGYAFFTLPALAPSEEVLTRIAAQLVNAFAMPELAGDEEAIGNFLQAAEDEANQILRREGLLAE